LIVIALAQTQKETLMGWLLPVGTPGGINSGLDGIPDGNGVVRLGEDLVGLDWNLYRVWRAAAAAPQVEELRTWANTNGILAVDECISVLRDAGLLIEDGPHARLHVGRLALRLIGECLGNGSELSSTFFVVGRNNVQLQVDAYVFELLMRCDGLHPISAMCDLLDASAPQPGWPPCIDVLTAGLPMLVRNEVVQLGGAVPCTDRQ
jgi:hypothetical protein